MYQNITQQSLTCQPGMDTTTSSIASSSSFVRERTYRSSRTSWCQAYLILAVLGSIVPSISSFTIQTNHPISLSNRISTQSRSSIYSTIDRPSSSSSSEMSSFEKRMRRLINPKNTATQKKRKSYGKSNVPPNLIKIQTLNEYKDMICKNKDRIVVVRFYATWCKACKAIAPSYYRLATTYKDALFVDVPVTPENANLHQGLGVPSLPFGHIYHPTGGLVEELKIAKKNFPKFARVLKYYLDGKCDVEEYEEIMSKVVDDGDEEGESGKRP